MFDSIQRQKAGLVAAFIVATFPLWITAACGGSTKPTVFSASSASAPTTVPLFSQSSGASPIHMRHTFGACEVEVRDGLGATYRWGEGSADQVRQAFVGAAEGCLSTSKGTHGTMYLEAKVSANGSLSDVIISPGGAVSTDVARCMSNSFGKVTMPAPKEAGSVLLLFIVSRCPPP